MNLSRARTLSRTSAGGVADEGNLSLAAGAYVSQVYSVVDEDLPLPKGHGESFYTLLLLASCQR